MIVSRERRPTPVWILRMQKKTVTTVSDVCSLGPKRKHRIACWLQCSLSRGTERGPTSARKLSPNKFGGQVAGNHRDSSPRSLVERIVFAVKNGAAGLKRIGNSGHFDGGVPRTPAVSESAIGEKNLGCGSSRNLRACDTPFVTWAAGWHGATYGLPTTREVNSRPGGC